MAAFIPNMAWHCLSGPQRHISIGTERARRFAPGYSAILSFIDHDAPAFDELAPFCPVGEALYAVGYGGEVPADWQLHGRGVFDQMLREPGEPLPAVDLPLQRLAAEHVPQMLALAELTKPGPFGELTVQMGEYVGVFEGGRLIAMAGERMFTGSLREISGVCTHPDAQGRGLARQLVTHLVQQQTARGERSFLHVASSNSGAIRIYDGLGFRRVGTIPGAVVSRQL